MSFHRHHQHPEVPIQPANHKAGAVAQTGARELRERAYLGQRRGHFSQHAHHQQNQQAGYRIADEDGGSGGNDGGAAADEQARADDAADGNHR
jgi:hypothetical protein